MYLLDTNIVIYWYDGKRMIFPFLEALGQSQYSISIVTRMEVMMGTHSALEEIESYLDEFLNINLDSDIVREAILLDRQNMKKLKFKDLIIAATAKCHGMTLVTSDKGFQNLYGVKVLHCPVGH